MRREDWPPSALLAEAVCLILEAVYLVLQIYYGLEYQVQPKTWILNIVMALLVYLVFSLLAVYPEKLNRLPPQMCTGQVRKLSQRMVRLLKLLFVGGLMVPSVADVLGVELLDAYSLIVMGLMVGTAVYYEARIIRILREGRR